MKVDPPVILVAWERVVGDLFERSERFPRSVRHSLGVRIENRALDVLEGLAKARFQTTGAAKQRTLLDTDEALLQLRVLLRLAHARKCLDTGGFEHVMRGIEDVGKQLGSWRQHVG